MNLDVIFHMDPEMIKSVLDSLNSLIYVSDFETNEILFISKKMQEAYGGDLSGHICWQVLHSNQNGPCPLCPCSSLLSNPSNPVIWEELNTVTGCFYQNTDSIIQWTESKIAHIRHAVDITDSRNAQAGMQLQIKQQEFLTAVSMRFASPGEFKSIMIRVLQEAGLLLNIERTSVFTHSESGDHLELLYEWSRHQVDRSLKIIPWLELDPKGELLSLLKTGAGSIEFHL